MKKNQKKKFKVQKEGGNASRSPSGNPAAKQQSPFTFILAHEVF
jgi:hypothetical protein